MISAAPEIPGTPPTSLPLAAPTPRAAGSSALSPISLISPTSPITTPAPAATVARRLAPAAATEAGVPPSAALAVPAAPFTGPFTGLSPNLGLAILRRRLDVPLQERLSAAAAPGVSRPETRENGGAAAGFPALPLAAPGRGSGAGVPAPPGPGPGSAAGPSALPLARVLQPSFTGRPGGIQRDLMGGAAAGPPAATPAPPSTPAAGEAPAAGAAPADDKTHDKAVEAEELAERILHRVLRTLAIEGERRGLSSWL
jgi:hypothetical protein